MLQAVNYVKPLSGWSTPHLMECSDGNLYVVKLTSNPQGIRVLVNEMICFRLAKRLNLPVPDGQVVYIDESLRSRSLSLGIDLGRGPHYGSRYVPDSTNFPTDEELGSCHNIAQAADIIAFDHWLDNNDRHLWREDGQNILVSRGANPQLWMIDNANIFNGPNWTVKNVMNSLSVQHEFWGPLYAKFAPHLQNPDPFGQAIARINALTAQDFHQITADLPVLWGVTDGELATLAFALEIRRNSLVPRLHTLQEKYLLPGLGI
ncbi:HipA family kinase [Paenibacillus sp. CN-4]|uniref:HipA family kinase n=1 Tax=Paenibacillus nanchangensis TaxID=3348343 RepID=UPI00397DCBBF